jgi:neutral ceramidase
MKQFLIIAAALVTSVPVVGAADFRAGVAAVRITPEQPLPMAGYYSVRLSTNTHDELHAKAIVLEQDGARAALVVCDLISLPRTVVVQAQT